MDPTDDLANRFLDLISDTPWFTPGIRDHHGSSIAGAGTHLYRLTIYAVSNGSGFPLVRRTNHESRGPVRLLHSLGISCSQIFGGRHGLREFQAALSHHQCSIAAAPQHFLNFLPLPQGQGSLRPTLGCWRSIVLASMRSCTAFR
jgi:hypothetical protein